MTFTHPAGNPKHNILPQGFLALTRLCEHNSVCQKNCNAILAENVAGRSLSRFVQNVADAKLENTSLSTDVLQDLLVGNYVSYCLYRSYLPITNKQIEIKKENPGNVATTIPGYMYHITLS